MGGGAAPLLVSRAGQAAAAARVQLPSSDARHGAELVEPVEHVGRVGPPVEGVHDLAPRELLALLATDAERHLERTVPDRADHVTPGVAPSRLPQDRAVAHLG